MSRWWIVTALLCLGASAQTPDTATIQGVVSDPSGAVVPGAKITAKNTLTGFERTTESRDSGRFTLAGLPISGTYTISASKQGFLIWRRDGVTLVAGSAGYLKISLDVSSVDRMEVDVVGVLGEVRTDQPQLGVRLDSHDMESTPLLNRKITYLPLLNAANRPAINQGDIFMNQNLFTTNGAGRRQTWFEVDGATGNDSWGRQTIFSTLPLTSAQEMTVLSNAFSAEYGGSTGSVVNIVTRSGGNKLHGEIVELWRPADTSASLSGFTTANAASGNDLTSDTLGQSALMLSGPIGSSGRSGARTPGRAISVAGVSSG